MTIKRAFSGNNLYFTFTDECLLLLEGLASTVEDMGTTNLHLDIGGAILADMEVQEFDVGAGSVSIWPLHFQAIYLTLSKELERGLAVCSLPCHPFKGLLLRKDALDLYTQMREKFDEIKEKSDQAFDRYDRAMSAVRDAGYFKHDRPQNTDIN